jgi:CMP-N,N'-diacetyllegionaminic acid synthase
MKVLGLIPARGGSQTVKRKNMVDLGGIPLIEWTIRTALASSISKLIVSTDDLEIAEFSQSKGCEVPFIRPSELATNSALSIDVVNHALNVINEDFDAVMLLQPTTPFRTPEDIEQSLKIIGDASSVISVSAVEGPHPARMKYIESGLLIDPPFAEPIENMPRQQLRKIFVRNGAIYLTKVPYIRQGSFKGLKSRALIMPEERSVNIDSHFDLRIARAIYNTSFSQNENV